MASVRRGLSHIDDLDGALIVRGFPLLEFDRSPIDRTVLKGFCLGWNELLTLVQIVDDVHFRLNGYAIFHNSQVKRWRVIPPDDFVGRAARLNRLHPSKPTGVKFSSMRRALSSAGKAFPLITIHREHINRRVCYVGKVRQVSQRAITMVSISPQAEWETDEIYQLKDITLVEFGGAYETLLARMSAHGRD